MEDSRGRPATQSVEDAASVDHAARKRWIVTGLFVYAAIFGVILCFLPEGDSPLDFVLTLPGLILAIAWCVADANERGHRIGLTTKLLLIFLFFIGLPVYLMNTRGAAGIKAIGLAVLLFAGLVVCMFVAAFATLFVGEFLGVWQVEY